MARPRKGYHLNWQGDQVVRDVTRQVCAAWDEIGTAVETEAKQQLYPGHGVVTGDLRSSIRATATIEQKGRLTLQVGSPLVYAMYIEIGGVNFAGYHYMRLGLAKVQPRIKDFVRKHVARQFKPKGQ